MSSYSVLQSCKYLLKMLKKITRVYEIPFFFFFFTEPKQKNVDDLDATVSEGTGLA